MIKLLILVFLLLISLEDIKTYEIKTRNLIILFLLEIAYLTFNFNYIQIMNFFLFGGIVFVIFYIFYMLFRDKIGGGDVKIIAIVSILYNFDILYILLLSSIFGMIAFVLSKKEKLPYVPFLTCSMIVFEFIKCYNL